jgi:hypothetical protein
MAQKAFERPFPNSGKRIDQNCSKAALTGMTRLAME